MVQPIHRLAPNLRDQQIGRHPEEGIDHKEDTGPQRVGLIAESGIQLVGLFGETDIRTVKKRQHVQRQQ